MIQWYTDGGENMPIQENLEKIKKNIDAAAKKAGKSAEDIILLGATKTVEPERMQTAINMGLSHIGENRVQELVDKYDKVQGATWHFIGHLQTNKVKYIIDKAALIHAADSTRILDEIERQAAKHGMRAHVLLEINASGEESKFGMPFEAARPIIEENEKRQHVQIDGLMTIGPNTKEEGAVRAAFARMRALYERLGTEKFQNCRMEYLSMGMSGDYEAAIEEGANIVRIGSAIFGYREYGGKQ